MALRELFQKNLVSLARLPSKNDFLLNDGVLELNRLSSLSAYSLFLIGHDYAAKTPVMWNSLYEKLGLNIRSFTVVVRPDNLGDVIAQLKFDPNYIGGNIGVGLKELIIPYLAKTVPEDLVSVNTIIKRDGLLFGRNTDSEGFVKSLEERLALFGKSVAGRNFVVVGAGGVAKEVVRLLARKGACNIAVINRTVSKAAGIAEDINRACHKQIAFSFGEDEIGDVLFSKEYAPCAVINLSDKGSDAFPASSMFCKDSSDGEVIARSIVRRLKASNPELVYADIILPKSGRSKSLQILDKEGVGKKFVLDGVPMVVYQAVPQFLKLQEAWPLLHAIKASEAEALSVFRHSAGLAE